MTVTDLRTTATVPAGWYPDPVDAAGLRWWSGESWTEHTAAPEPVVPAEVAPEPVTTSYADTSYFADTYVADTVAAEPLAASWDVVDPVAPDLGRFSRDPLVTGQPASISAATMAVSGRKDPYRDRNVFSGIALVVAVIGLLVFVAGQLLELPDFIRYIAGGTPFTIAAFAIVVAIRTGRGMMLAVIAAVLSALNLAMGMALNAVQASDDISTALDSSPTFEQSLELSLVESANTLGMEGVATEADCPNVPTPVKGAVIECIVTYDTGYSYRVDVTSEDGLGGMSFELDDTPIGAAAG